MKQIPLELHTNNSDEFSIFCIEDQYLIDSLQLPKLIKFYRADKFDSTFVNTESDSWQFLYSGDKLRLKFQKFNHLEKKLVKFFLASYIQINTPSSLDDKLSVFIYALNYLKNNKLNISYKNLKTLLIQLAKDNKSTYYYHLKFFIKLLFLEEFKYFPIEQEYELEFIERPKSFNSKLYYQQNIDPIEWATISMIQKGFIELNHNIKRLDQQTLFFSSILGLVYTSGLRPVQLAKLSVQDIRVDTTATKENQFHRYSILIPYAKQARYVHEKIAIKLPEEIATILIAYIKKSNLLPDDQLFDMGDNAARFCSRAINTQLFNFSPSEYQSAVISGEIIRQKYSYSDFRHHVGYSLAMSGSSAEEIAYILGHSSLVTARHYIFSTPELAQIRAQALGQNSLYHQMIAMILTGRLVYKSEWDQKMVIGNIGDTIHYDIGGCAYKDKCLFHPVRNCYGCIYFHPFIDGNHRNTLSAIQREIEDLVRLSDGIGITRNPLIRIHETTKFEIESVITRCSMYKGEANESSTI